MAPPASVGLREGTPVHSKVFFVGGSLKTLAGSRWFVALEARLLHHEAAGARHVVRIDRLAKGVRVAVVVFVDRCLVDQRLQAARGAADARDADSFVGHVVRDEMAGQRIEGQAGPKRSIAQGSGERRV